MAEDTAATPLPRAGEILDERFEIRALLGEGGMGHVFRVHDHRLGREVALKLIVPRYLGRPEREARFLRELELGRRAGRHPHLVEMIDGGRLRSGWPFLVMALVEGKALANRVALGPLRVHVATRMARQVASAVQALHRCGVVHRDITPMNVLTHRNEAVLIDLSHAGDAAAPRLPMGHPARLTRDNEVPGTHQYMPPEQARSEPAHPAMDVYAFGVTFADMLIGLAPDNVSREVFIELQREGKIEPPHIDTRIHTHVPRPLAELVSACTALEPRERPTLDEIVRRLDHAISTMPRSEEPSGPAVAAFRPAVEPARTTEPMPDRLRAATSISPPPPLDMEETPPGGAPIMVGRYEERAAGGRLLLTAVAVVLTVLAVGVLAWWLWSTRLVPPGGEAADRSGASQAESDTASRAGAVADEPQAPDAGPRTVASDEAPPLPVARENVAPAPSPSVTAPAPDAGQPTPASPKVKPKGKPKAKPTRPDAPSEPSPANGEECVALRGEVEQAASSAAWSKVAKLTRRRECWSSQADRKRLRVRALFESQAWSDCVDEGRGVTEPQVKQWVDLCQRHVD